MNKQLERDLQCSIQCLKANQLANVLARYEQVSQTLCSKTLTSTSILIQRRESATSVSSILKVSLPKALGEISNKLYRMQLKTYFLC